MSELKPIKDSILFTFVQTTRDGYFRNETDWGFKIAGSDYDSSKARWGLAEIVGPDCKYVKPGDYIMIEPLKWTTAVEHEGKKYWRTAEAHVELTSDKRPSDII
jgi:hypothetical protein